MNVRDAELFFDETYDSEHFRLLALTDKALEKTVLEGGTLLFKANEGHSAVLCTHDKTFDIKKVESSNLRLLYTLDDSHGMYCRLLSSGALAGRFAHRLRFAKCFLRCIASAKLLFHKDLTVSDSAASSEVMTIRALGSVDHHIEVCRRFFPTLSLHISCNCQLQPIPMAPDLSTLRELLQRSQIETDAQVPSDTTAPVKVRVRARRHILFP